MSRTLDRTTLLKGAGMAALGSVLMGASQGGVIDCCDPIDLTFQVGSHIKRKERQKAYAPFYAIRFISRKQNEITQPPIPKWNSLGLMATAQLLGNDPFGNKGLKETKMGDLWVYGQ